MKKAINIMNRFLLLFFFTGLQAITWAQDNGQSTPQTTTNSTTTTTTTSKEFYTQPWAWVVGGVLLILIIALIARGSNTSRTTVIKD